MGDLQGAPDQLLAIGLAFDAICTVAVRRFVAGGGRVNESDVALAFVETDVVMNRRRLTDEHGRTLAVARRAVPVSALFASSPLPSGVAVFLGRHRLPLAWRTV
jgi:hypothetical protein